MRRAEEGLIMLTCALGQGVVPLSNTEYQHLSELMRRHAPLEAEKEVTVPFFCRMGYPQKQAERIVGLLNRDNVLRAYLSQPNISAVTRLNELYPARLRRLDKQMPPVLFCKGDVSLLRTRCIALVGSRQLSERNAAFAAHIGKLAAHEGFTLVSGGATGADTAAQEACLANGGKVICFVPDALKRYRLRENLLYCSDEGYEYAFTAARALRRNHFIHALGEKTFVAACPRPKGGTWSGTSYNLNHHLSEVFILDDGTEGARVLTCMGAVSLTDFPPSLTDLLPMELSIFD